MATQLKKGTLELCVIALLSHREWYGYELTQELNKELVVKDATIYLILQRLEKAGFVHSYIKQIEQTTKMRKYYLLSEEGKIKLQELTTEWESLKSIVAQCITQGGLKNE